VNAQSLTREELARLATLQDIVEPATVHFWPAAPAWWLIALLVLLLTIRLAQHAWKQWRRERYRRAALRRLSALESRRHAQPPQQTVQDALTVLHECVFSMPASGSAYAPPPTDRAAWIGFLRARAQASHPTVPETLLRDAPYWPPERVSASDASTVLHFVRSWIVDHERPA